MSSRKLTINLSDPAKKDFKSIIRYTKRKWGKEQALTYREMLRNQLDIIRENPQIGHQKPDLQQGILALHVKRHFIFYQLEGNTVYILRILHDSMDYAWHLQ